MRVRWFEGQRLIRGKEILRVVVGQNRPLRERALYDDESNIGTICFDLKVYRRLCHSSMMSMHAT